MAVTYEQLQTWKPEELDTAADQLNTARKSFQDQQDEMDAGKVPDTWVGEASTRAENRHRRLIADLNDMAAPLSQVINALDEAAASIKKAKDSAKHAYDDATGRGWKVSFSGGVQITDPSPDEKDPDKDKGTMQQLAQTIQDALTDAASADADLTAVLNHATKGDYDGGDGTIEQASLPPELRNLPEDELIDKMLSDPGKYDGYIDALPPDAQTRLGKEISDRLDSTLNDDDYKLSKEEADRLNSMLSAYTDDSTVAAGLYKDLGADGTVASMARIEEYLRMQSPDGESVNTLASNLRNGLASASNDPGFPAEQFGHDIVKYSGPSGLYLSDDEQDALRDRYPNWGGTGGASVLTYLMKDHDLNGNLVLGAAEELDRFERAENAVMDAKTWYQHTGHSPLDTGNEGGWGDDPMAAILGNLGDHPEQGYQFLTEDKARQDYYFDKRTWQADGYAGVSELAEGIGTSQELLKEHPQETTGLVSKFFHDVSDNEGFNAEDAKAASPHVAELMKFYTPGVDAALHNPGSGEPGTEPFKLDHYGNMDPYPKFYKDDLENMMKVSMSTQDGMTSIAEGVGTFQQTQINNIAAELAQNPNDPGLRTELRDVLERGGHLQGFAERAVGDVEIDGAKDRDAQRQAFIDLTSEVAGMVPLPGAEQVGELGSKLIDYGVGQAIDLGKDAAGEKFANEAAAATSNAETRASEGVNRVELNALFALERAGVIDIPPSDETFVKDGKIISLSDVPAGDVDRYAHEAMNYLNEYVTAGDFEGSYKNAFLDYYKKE
ncbi:WXG100 family type VII secretion target [Nocardioides sp. NBC_00163]|uniref:WXG100 family type VII secretion target n=1 Tax=Nocardioides sp. NBC_00163 TaxID=2975999 RepID=UPI003250A34D